MEYVLATNDYVGISFWLATAIMLASTVFFFIERSDVKGKWKTSLTVAGLVTGIAFWHYLYMRDVWVMVGDTPTVYRYIDWLITVPLQIIEFYLVIAAVTAISAAIFLEASNRINCDAGFWISWRNWINGCNSWLGDWNDLLGCTSFMKSSLVKLLLLMLEVESSQSTSIYNN